MALTQYWVAICVRFHKPEKIIRQNGTKSGACIHGYYRSIGITAQTQEIVQEKIKGLVTDGSIDWSDSYIEPTTLEETDLELTDLIADPNSSGIWYKSGRGLFSEDVEEDEVPE